MSRLSTLKAASSLTDLAILLGFKPRSISYILYKQPTPKYQIFLVPKRSGGYRTISAPCDALKRLQRNLAELLQDCLDELAAAKKRSDRASHGFARRRSIITNARQHRHRRWVFNLDLEEFFPSINFGRIRGYFIKNRDFELNSDVATVLAQIACNGDSLPQGSPCSPVIANLIAHVLDIRLVALARTAGCTYSRYADDLSFSTNKREIPPEIALPSGLEGPSAHLWLAGDQVRGIIERSGFRINDKKTHLMYRSSRQEVTGLVVNEKISVPSGYRHGVRAMVDKLVKTGSYDLFASVEKDGVVAMTKRPGTVDELHGMLGFVDSIDVYNSASASRDGPKSASTSAEKTYRRFLFYRTFYAAQCPVVICEGETDNIYLTHAIRSLAAEFPDLAEVQANKKVRLLLRLFKYPQSSTARLLGLRGGGSAVLGSFIGTYNREISGFGGAGLAHPVIILFDNDSGSKSVWGPIQGITKRPRLQGAPFVHITRNLYAVPTPGEDSKIEDFFDATAKARQIGAKTFNDGNHMDTERHYGKKVFAHKVVRPNADLLDFSGFRPLLSNLAEAIRAHTATQAPGT